MTERLLQFRVNFPFAVQRLDAVAFDAERFRPVVARDAGAAAAARDPPRAKDATGDGACCRGAAAAAGALLVETFDAERFRPVVARDAAAVAAAAGRGFPRAKDATGEGGCCMGAAAAAAAAAGALVAEAFDAERFRPVVARDVAAAAAAGRGFPRAAAATGNVAFCMGVTAAAGAWGFAEAAEPLHFTNNLSPLSMSDPRTISKSAFPSSSINKSLVYCTPR